MVVVLTKIFIALDGKLLCVAGSILYLQLV